MQGVPIKFRGIEDIKDGKYVYGDYVTRENGGAIRVKTSDNLFNLHEYEVAVKPETVAQLVGYDANGEEIYDGDIVVDEQYKDRLFLPRQYADKTVVRVETSSLRSDYSGSAFVPLQTRISHTPPYESINVRIYLYKGALVDDGEVV